MNQNIINLKSQTDLSGFYILYQGSTFNEKEGIRGLSHLGEHLHCKNFDHLMEEFDENGISWNAYTASDHILFYFTGLEEKISLYRDKILNLLQKNSVTEEQFENERNIVIEEYENSFNDQSYFHGANLERKLFNDYNPIGELNDLKTLSYNDFLDFFNLQYKNPSKIFNVSKTFEFDSNIKFAEYNTKLDIPISYIKDNKFIFQESNEFKEKTSIIYFSDIVTDDFNIVTFITNMLGYGLKSPLYDELREKRGLVYYVRCNLDKKNNVSGVISIDAITSNKNVDVFKNTLDELLKQPEKYLTKERFDVIKNMLYVKYKIKNINRYNNITDLIYPKEWNMEYILDTLTLDDVKSVYNKYFTNWYKSTDKEEFK